MRISGIEIPDHDRAGHALQKFYGIGKTNVLRLIKQAGIKATTRVKDLTRDEVSSVMKALESFHIEGDLRRELRENIDRLRAIHAYRGLRHMSGLPVRGQRTKTNARTRKGKRKTVGSMTKEAWAKVDMPAADAKAAAKPAEAAKK